MLPSLPTTQSLVYFFLAARHFPVICMHNVQVGCENVEINCAATDVNYVLNSRSDGGWNLDNFKSCLRAKCERQSDGRYVNKA